MLALACLVGIGISLGGCGRFSCAGDSPIRPSKDDVLTEGTAKQILTYNETKQKLGCPGFSAKGKFF
jgi:hypothetical protein